MDNGRGRGTSAVAPLYAGLLARVNALTGKSNGLINPALYNAQAQNGFYDILQATIAATA